MKMSTIAADVSSPTWIRRLPSVGSSWGATLSSSVSARHALAVSDAAYRAFGVAGIALRATWLDVSYSSVSAATPRREPKRSNLPDANADRPGLTR
jgi:hypothetical protein